MIELSNVLENYSEQSTQNRKWEAEEEDGVPTHTTSYHLRAPGRPSRPMHAKGFHPLDESQGLSSQVYCNHFFLPFPQHALHNDGGIFFAVMLRALEPDDRMFDGK